MVSQRYRDLVERPTETHSGKVSRVKPKRYFGTRSIAERRNSFYPWCIPAKRRFVRHEPEFTINQYYAVTLCIILPVLAIVCVIGEFAPIFGGN